MPSGVYERRPRPAVVRKRISESMKVKKIANATGKPVHPWNKWFAPHRVKFVIVKGVDFTCSIPSMLQSVRNRASERGVGVETQVDGKTVTVRLHRKPKSAYEHLSEID